MVSSLSEDLDERVRARIPADLDAAEQVMAGLTAGQLLGLAVLTSPLIVAWQTLPARVPIVVLFTASGALVAVALALVMSRRDGLGLDRWLLSALRYRLSPRTISAAPDLTQVPSPGNGGAVHRGAGGGRQRSRRAQQQHGGRVGRSAPAPLADVTPGGVLVHADGRHVALIACTTIMTALSTSREEAVLAAGMGRWLNSLAGPVQILVRSRPTDLASRATDVAVGASRLENRLLAALALDHAEMLLDVYESERPLQRSVLIACSGGVSTGAEHLSHRMGELSLHLRARIQRRSRTDHRPRPTRTPVSRRASAEALTRAHRSAAELQDLGVDASVLDAAQVREVLRSSWTPCLLPSAAEHRTASSSLPTNEKFHSKALLDLGEQREGSSRHTFAEAGGEPGDDDWADDRPDDWPDDWDGEQHEPGWSTDPVPGDEDPWPEDEQSPQGTTDLQAEPQSVTTFSQTNAEGTATQEVRAGQSLPPLEGTSARGGGRRHRQRLFDPVRAVEGGSDRRPR